MTVIDGHVPLDEIPVEWVACFSSPHWMDTIPVPASERHHGVNDVWWRCIRCGSERYDQHDPATWKVLARKYNHPRGYIAARKSYGSRLAWRGRYLALTGAISDRQARRLREIDRQAQEQRARVRAERQGQDQE